MPATKKVTETIAEDMRAQYESGNATQAELADLFNVSVPTVNKTVKGVRPVKRKYRVNSKKSERDAELIAAYDPDNGVDMKSLAERFNMTHQNVSLILKTAGINPQQDYFSKLKQKAADRKQQIMQEKLEKKQENIEKVNTLSRMWIDGATVEQIREAAGLKSENAAQVKLVNLRKQYGDEMFPRRRSVRTFNAEDAQEKIAELSRIYRETPTDKEALGAVFGDEPASVVRRICQLRDRLEDGETLFPRQRKPKNPKVAETVSETVEEKEENDSIEESVDSLDFTSEEEISELE